METTQYILGTSHGLPLEQVKNINARIFKYKARKVHGTRYGYDKIDQYLTASLPVPITCKVHGTFLQTPHRHLAGKGCRLCNCSLPKGTDKFIEEATIVHKGRYKYPRTKYIDRNIKVTITCPSHGDYEQPPRTHLYGALCPRCRIVSKGEEAIVKYLEKKKIAFRREYRLPGERYRYDFYLPHVPLLIEYHGRQHYFANSGWGGKKGFLKRVRHDKIKVELAKRNNLDLLVITYPEIKEVDSVLEHGLFNKNIATRVMDVSHIYALYGIHDKGEDSYTRFYNILITYLRGEDEVPVIKRTRKVRKKVKYITNILRACTSKDMMDNFIRLSPLEHKLILKSTA